MSRFASPTCATVCSRTVAAYDRGVSTAGRTRKGCGYSQARKFPAGAWVILQRFLESLHPSFGALVVEGHALSWPLATPTNRSRRSATLQLARFMETGPGP